MTKREYYDRIHQYLAQKHGLDRDEVALIRTFAIGDKFDRLQIAAFCANQRAKMRKRGNFRTGRRRQRQSFYEHVINFVASCSDDAWNEITTPKPFALAEGD